MKAFRVPVRSLGINGACGRGDMKLACLAFIYPAGLMVVFTDVLWGWVDWLLGGLCCACY